MRAVVVDKDYGSVTAEEDVYKRQGINRVRSYSLISSSR